MLSAASSQVSFPVDSFLIMELGGIDIRYSKTCLIRHNYDTSIAEEGGERNEDGADPEVTWSLHPPDHFQEHRRIPRTPATCPLHSGWGGGGAGYHEENTKSPKIVDALSFWFCFATLHTSCFAGSLFLASCLLIHASCFCHRLLRRIPFLRLRLLFCFFRFAHLHTPPQHPHPNNHKFLTI